MLSFVRLYIKFFLYKAIINISANIDISSVKTRFRE